VSERHAEIATEIARWLRAELPRLTDHLRTWLAAHRTHPRATTGYLLLFSPIIGLVLIAYEKISDRARDVRWPVALTVLTAVPLIAIVVASRWIGF
jgi:hypothetical protein